MKKTILHFIYDLERGGAETMLVSVLKELPEYNNIVVTLYPVNKFKDELECTKYICLNQGSLLAFPFTAIKLRKLIKEYNVDIVHTHLFWPTLIARIATPKNIPLITTIHAFIAESVEYRKWFMRFLDKSSYKIRNSIIIGVAKGVTKEYFSFLKLKPFKSYALYTFVDTNKFRLNSKSLRIEQQNFRLISVGALRLQKNHQFLVEAFKLLKDENIELDIYGIGPFQHKLEQQILNSGIKINLKGIVTNMQEVLPQYDLFVMSSTYEGFSLGVLETMAMKVPLLLSDIVSFREQCENTAIYFNLNNVQDFADKVKDFAADPALRIQLSEAAYKRVIDNFTLPHHMNQLKKIYIDSLTPN